MRVLLAELMAVYISIDAKRAPHESLSNREFQVMRLIASGKTVSAIARELSLSVRTVSTRHSAWDYQSILLVPSQENRRQRD